MSKPRRKPRYTPVDAPAEQQTYAQAFASLGGKARAAKLSKARLSEIGRNAIAARWAGHTKKSHTPK